MGAWTLQAESTGCREADRRGAIDYVARRQEELVARGALAQVPIRVMSAWTNYSTTCSQAPHEPARKNYKSVLTAHLRPFSGKRLRLRSRSAIVRSIVLIGVRSRSRTRRSIATSPRSARPSRYRPWQGAEDTRWRLRFSQKAEKENTRNPAPRSLLRILSRFTCIRF